MITAIIVIGVAIILIKLIGMAFDVGFWGGLLIVLGLLALFLFVTWLCNKYEKKFPKLANKGFFIALGSVALFLVIAIIIGICSTLNTNSNYKAYDDFMAGQNWGKGRYYNSSSHQVEKNVWGMTH